MALDQLAAKAKAGDKTAEEELLERLRIGFIVFIQNRLYNTEATDVEDLAHEAIAVVLKKYKTVEFRKGFAKWAYSVLWNTIGNEIQRRQRDMKRLTSLEGEIEYKTSPYAFSHTGKEEFLDLQKRLLDCCKKIAKVNRRYVRILNLNAQGFKTGEIAQRLHITPNNCYKILHCGRNMLRRCLETGRI